MWNVTRANVSKAFRFFLVSNDLAFQEENSKVSKTETFPPSTRERVLTVASFSACLVRCTQGGKASLLNMTWEKPALTWLGSADLQPWPSDPTLHLTTGRGWEARYLQRGPGRLLTVLSRLHWPHFIEPQISRMEKPFSITWSSIHSHKREKTEAQRKRWPAQGHTVGCV